MSVCTGTLYEHVPVYVDPRVVHIHCIVRRMQVYACVCQLHVPLCVCTYVCTCMHTMYTHRAPVCLCTCACAGMHMLPAHACATLAQIDDSEALVPCGYLNESSGCPHGPHQRHDVRGHDVRGHSVSPGRRHCLLSALGPATQHPKCPGTKANRRP